MIYVGYCPEGFCRAPEVFLCKDSDAIPADVRNCFSFADEQFALAEDVAKALADVAEVQVSRPTGL